ncbi:MAG: MiaB/RimO family radical SAM methylthiotransferase, partial [Chloroflexi bacterium]|nr:MiaB/RimO family radical SAM methylthiotransferase [Chloroflexota bacterium]
QLIRRAAAHAGALVVVTGCYATTAAEEIAAIPGVGLVVGQADKERLVELVEGLRGRGQGPTLSLATAAPAARTRAFIKVQDGCDSFCTYCIVPFARGAPRSVPLAAVLAQVQERAAAGCVEVVLTGVHLGLYGQETALGLRQLVTAVLAETPIRRLRLSSIEPQDLLAMGGEELAAFFALWQDRRLCRHLHLPLQSGCAATLQRMGRRYTAEDYARLVAAARRAIPDLAVTTDVIVGFPGESEAEFRASYDFAAALGCAKLHVFRFSPRRGTAAACLAPVKARTMKERSAAMLALSEEGAAAFRRAFLGRTMEVLWEEKARKQKPVFSEKTGFYVWTGLTDNYLRVYAASAADLTNRLWPAHLLATHADGLWGELNVKREDVKREP